MNRYRATLVVAILALTASSEVPTTAPGVAFFSPQGTIKKVRQVAVRFSSPMVTLGDPRLPGPFEIDCPASGSGRWADPNNWVYDFDQDLPGGIRCRFTLKQSLMSHAGIPLVGERSYVFDTGGPSIRASFPREGWHGVDEDQIFVLGLDAPATRHSIEAKARCVVKGISELISVEVLEGPARKAVLDQRDRFGYSYYRLLWKSDRRSDARVKDGSLERAEEKIVALKCRRRLPPETKIQLVWGSGITAPNGLSTTQDQTLAFRTRPAFLAHFQCDRVNAKAGCLPMKPMRLVFSSTVPIGSAALIRLIDSKGIVYKPKIEQHASVPVTQSVVFPGPFPARSEFKIKLPPKLLDDAKRLLQNIDRFPLTVSTAGYPPLVKFSGTFGILELEEGGVLPVTLRNVEPNVAALRLKPGTRENGSEVRGRSLRLIQSDAEIANWLRRVEAAMRFSGQWVRQDDGKNVWRELTGSKSVFEGIAALTSFVVPKPLGAKEFEVGGIPLKEPGLHIVELASPLLGAALMGDAKTRYVATAALVTNMAVHFQWGREASLIWVTSLDDGVPVAGAKVVVSDFCNGAARWKGVTGSDGIVRVPAVLPEPQSWTRCGRRGTHPLMVSARSGRDMSFTLTTWNKGIGPSDFGLPQAGKWQADIVHTVFDRPLFRAGETASMKHFVRRHTTKGFDLPSGFSRITKVRIVHRASRQSIEVDAEFDESGVAETKWSIPKDAKLGEYEIEIRLRGTDWRTSGRFRVAEFRVPTMRAVVQAPSEPLVNARSARLDLFVQYLSGGGASGAAVKLRTLVQPRKVKFPGYGDYSFGGEDVKVGVVLPAQGGSGGSSGQTKKPSTARILPLTLDVNGGARVTVPDLPVLRAPARLVAELEFEDANGEIRTTAIRVPLWSAALSLGIKTEGWAASTDQLRLRILAVDLKGKPIADRTIEVELFSRATYSYRKRLVGGFYSYENIQETKRIDARCSGKTDKRGLLLCDLAPEVAGEVLIRAKASDGSGNTAVATRSVWVVGKDEWWFAGTNGDRMDVLPERKEYQNGDVARLQVRMPFRTATALVTVGREGVIDSFVTELSGREPVIEVPIKGNYAPNIFVSVLVVRGRLGIGRSVLASLARSNDLSWFSRDGGRATATIDLSKPAYRLGITKIRVGWRPHRLTVRVTPERSTYKIRQTAKVRIAATRVAGGLSIAGTEVAVAVVDEGLLELAGNKSWNLLTAMMGERGYEVLTSTAQMQVVGKRHYGRKAVLDGGGGGVGRGRARELFDTLLVWKGRVRLDHNGEAEIEVPLNDSLTTFRIVAIAHMGLGLFGTGQAKINTTQDLMIHSGLPPLIRESDRFRATFSVRNTTDAAIQVKVTAKVTPMPIELPTRTIEIPPGTAREVNWSLDAPSDTKRLEWAVEAKSVDGGSTDRIGIKQKVIAAFPVRIYQATLTQLDAPLSLAVKKPVDAIAGRGGLSVTLRSRLSGGLEGVRDYMSRYDYVCFEQRASKAVALRDAKLWQSVMGRAFAYIDQDGLIKYFPMSRLRGSDSLTAYILAISHEAGWRIPNGLRSKMLGGLRKFVDGRIIRDTGLRTADLTIRKLTAIEALSRYGNAKPHMLTSLSIEPNLWPTSAVLDWINVLKRLSDIPKRAERLKEAKQIIRSRLNFQGTTMGFSTERADALWWLMISTDSNAVRSILGLLDDPDWRQDIPRMVRGALGRQLKGHWNTTLANAWGVLAMERFSAAFETEAVTGETNVRLGKISSSANWAGDTEYALPEFGWGDRSQELTVRHDGEGRPWAVVRAKAAIPLKKPLSSGYRIKRIVTPIERAAPNVWTRGDVIRVKIEIEAQSDMTWVVVDDPIPAGASILGGGLGRGSLTLTGGERRQGWAWQAYEERRFSGYRAYYRFVPKGTWSVEYTARLNNPGRFNMPATRVEAMYAPEMFGMLPNEPMVVEANP